MVCSPPSSFAASMENRRRYPRRIPGASVPAVTRVHELHGWPLRQNLACTITLHRFIVVATVWQRASGKGTGVIILLVCFPPGTPGFGRYGQHTRTHMYERLAHPSDRIKYLNIGRDRNCRKCSFTRQSYPAVDLAAVKYIKATPAINISLFTDNRPRMPGINSAKCLFN